MSHSNKTYTKIIRTRPVKTTSDSTKNDNNNKRSTWERNNFKRSYSEDSK